MKKVLILYRSKSGYTKKYALWAAKALNGEARKLDDVHAQQLAGYDTVVYGGGVYAGRINGMKKLKKLLPAFSGKRVFLFAVGLSAMDSEQAQKIRAGQLGAPAFDGTPAFYLRGGLDPAKLHGVDRLFIRMMAKNLAGEANPTPEQREMLWAVQQSGDYCTEEQFRPLIQAAKAEEHLSPTRAASCRP